MADPADQGVPPNGPTGVPRITIETIDRGVVGFFKSVVAAYADSPVGDRRPVPVTFSTGERWVEASDLRGLRDKDGRLILPVIQIKRTSIDPLNNRTALGANVPRMSFARLVDPITNDLANLDEARPISQRRLRGAAVYDVYTIPYPSTDDFPYQVLIRTQTQTQMNAIQEKLLSRLEFFNVPSFVIPLNGDYRMTGIQEGQGSTELIPEEHSEFEERPPLKSYYCVGYIDGPMEDDGNNSGDFTDQERMLTTTIRFHVPTALILDPDDTRPAVQVERTAFHVTMGIDGAVKPLTRTELDAVFAEGRPGIGPPEAWMRPKR